MTDEQKKRQQQLPEEDGSQTYSSPWEAQLEDTWNQLRERPDFQYDVNADALWNQYKDQYVRQGQLAMMDTMGKAQSMTGGYGNSYAQSAGQQTYQGYLQGLNDKLPQFYQLAQDQYNAQGDDLLSKYGILSDLEGRDYSRWLDDQTQRNWLTEWEENVRRYNFEHGLGDYAPTGGEPEGSPTGGGKSPAQSFVDRMLAGATSSKFDPERVISATNQLTDNQKKEAQKYLQSLLDKGQMAAGNARG